MLHPFALQVPADERYRVLAPEVAGKYVELSGGSAADVRTFAEDLTAALRQIAAGASHDAVVDLSFSSRGGHVEAAIHCGSRSTVVKLALPAGRAQGT